MKVLQKIKRFFFSMPFAIGLLVVLAVSCALSSLVTQGQTYSWYAARYGERMAAVIIALRLDDAYHSPWFLVFTGILCVNLLGCNLIRMPALIRRSRAQSSFRGRAGAWGAWVCHLGILLLIVGFALGQMTKQEWSVYGLPGQVRDLPEAGLRVKIDDFTVALRVDDTVEQYTSDITVTETATGREESARVQVNEPARLFGWNFYQNSTGYAARVRVLKDGEQQQEEILCVGESLEVEGKPTLTVYLQGFYPDYILQDGKPATASGQLNNPAYLYLVTYQGNVLGMNAITDGDQADDPLVIDEYTVLFDQPQSYTLLAVHRDDYTPLALFGGILVMLGLLMAFYLRTPNAVRETETKPDIGQEKPEEENEHGGA